MSCEMTSVVIVSSPKTQVQALEEDAFGRGGRIL